MDGLVRIGNRVINLANVTNMRLEEDKVDVQFLNGAIIAFRHQEAKVFRDWILTSGAVQYVEERDEGYLKVPVDAPPQGPTPPEVEGQPAPPEVPEIPPRRREEGSQEP